MSAAYDVALYIAQTLGKGIIGANVLCNYMPAEPMNCIAVFQYGGLGSSKGMGADSGALENPSVQVNVRNADSNQAEAIAKSIHDSFDELAVATTINGTVYTYFNPLSPPYLLERLAGSDGIKTTMAFNMDVQNRRS